MAEAKGPVDLETFLAGLPEPAGTEARTAATRIDLLERSVPPPNWIERNLSTLVIATLALFALGIASFAGLVAGLGGLFGLGGVVLMVAAFPGLVLIYAWSVRFRTAADREKMTLNQRYFLPHGGIYFGSPQGNGTVVRVATGGEGPNLRQRTEALYRQATPRRWWW
jgi:hypothetical protein